MTLSRVAHDSATVRAGDSERAASPPSARAPSERAGLLVATLRLVSRAQGRAHVSSEGVLGSECVPGPVHAHRLKQPGRARAKLGARAGARSACVQSACVNNNQERVTGSSARVSPQEGRKFPPRAPDGRKSPASTRARARLRGRRAEATSGQFKLIRRPHTPRPRLSRRRHCGRRHCRPCRCRRYRAAFRRLRRPHPRPSGPPPPEPPR